MTSETDIKANGKMAEAWRPAANLVSQPWKSFIAWLKESIGIRSLPALHAKEAKRRFADMSARAGEGRPLFETDFEVLLACMALAGGWDPNARKTAPTEILIQGAEKANISLDELKALARKLEQNTRAKKKILERLGETVTEDWTASYDPKFGTAETEAAPKTEEPTLISLASLRFLVRAFPAAESQRGALLAENLNRGIEALRAQGQAITGETKVSFDIRQFKNNGEEYSGKETLDIFIKEAAMRVIFYKPPQASSASQPLRDGEVWESPSVPVGYKIEPPVPYQIVESSAEERAAAAVRRTAARALRRAGKANAHTSG
jgi:hypothetical protein